MMTAALLLSSCAVQIYDEQFCAPVPGNLGAVCDNFLTDKQLVLDEQGWLALQASWQKAGNATECTSSATLGDIKGEIEKLCSKTSCTYVEQQQVNASIRNIDRMIALAHKSAERSKQ